MHAATARAARNSNVSIAAQDLYREREGAFTGEVSGSMMRKVGAEYIGETLDQRERNETFEVLDRQVKQGLDALTAEQIGQLVIAYEPVLAIGTGRNATAAQAGEAHAHVRKRLRQWFGPRRLSSTT